MDNTEWRQDIFRIREHVVCKDGFKFSVQASKGHHCVPQEDNTSYLGVEIGQVSEYESLLIPFADAAVEVMHGRPEGSVGDITIYDYVPANVILEVIAKHGGMVSGELPPLRVEEENIDVLMSDEGKEPYDFSLPVSEEEYAEEKNPFSINLLKRRKC